MDRPAQPGGRAWVRKEPCNFGWNWAPVLVTCGIWRHIELVAFDEARLADVLVTQDHSQPGKVKLTVQATAELANAQSPRISPLYADVAVAFNGANIAASSIELQRGAGSVDFDISHVRLWWPAGMGEHPLYDIAVKLRDKEGKTLDQATKRVGLRTFRIAKWGKDGRIYFAVNGVPFFAKGANYVPADVFPNRVSPEKLRRLVADAAAVNMNMLRFWGGGYYEEDELYDACDEAGICVWKDMVFSCSALSSV